MKRILVILPFALCFGGSAAAGVVLFDDFDAESGGATSGNYGGFANFDVSNGTVDLIGTPNLGIACKTGSCVDLDGTANDGAMLTTKNAYSVLTGERIVLSFDVSGSQRGTARDNFDFGFMVVGDAILFTDTEIDFGSTGIATPMDRLLNDSSGRLDLTADRPFERFSFAFTAGNTGLLKAYVRTGSADNIGPIVDNFSLSIGAVPEPEAWALLILGFGGIGTVMRSKAKATAKFGFA